MKKQLFTPSLLAELMIPVLEAGFVIGLIALWRSIAIPYEVPTKTVDIVMILMVLPLFLVWMRRMARF
ncbi:MAG: hypothetical protein RLZZ500_538 [Bacteroidota bacterium]